ncbi:MAG: LamG-like jellyroll fold domain-containing protein [Turneriella sp.]
MTALRRIFTFAAVCAATHCGNSGIYDEALTEYYRVVRSGLNEWYPLNGNLNSRIGNAAGSATASYSSGVNRAGESGKAVCTTTAEFLFASATIGTSPFTVSAWVKLNTLTAGPNSIIQKGRQQTGYLGFIVSQSGSTSWSMSYGEGSTTKNTTSSGVTAGVWYYLAFLTMAHGFLHRNMGPTLTQLSALSGAYNKETATTEFQIFAPATLLQPFWREHNGRLHDDSSLWPCTQRRRS